MKWYFLGFKASDDPGSRDVHVSVHFDYVLSGARLFFYGLNKMFTGSHFGTKTFTSMNTRFGEQRWQS